MSDNSSYMNLNTEFNRLLENFVYKELNEKRNQTNSSTFHNKSVIIDNSLKQKYNDYSKEIIKFMDNNNYLKEKIIEKAKNFLSEDKTIHGNSQKVVDKILHNNYIGKNTCDIISCILKYVKEEIFGKYIKYIFSALEDNNILTTLIEIQNNKSNEMEGTIIRELLEAILDNLTYDDKRV